MEDFTNLINQGIKAMENKNFSTAIDYFEEAKKLNCKNIRVHRLLGNCLRIIGNVDLAIEMYNKGLEIGYHEGTHKRLLNALNYVDISQELIAKEHILWADKNLKANKSQINKNLHKNEKIRIGYVSADFKAHPVAHFLQPVFKYHDKNLFDIYVYYNDDAIDAHTEQFKKYSTSFNFVKKLKTIELYNKICKDNIDILVDLSGHTSGNRLDVFKMKPAQFQVTYLGYPNTTGLKEVDYRIVDSITDPEDIPLNWHSEKLHRMKNCFLCFNSTKNIPIEDTPFNKNGYVTFGTFNKISKITDKMLKIWIKILEKVPNSKMILKSIGFAEKIEKELFYERLDNLGLKDTSRFILYDLVPSKTEHLKMYNLIDIALDTYPYNGTTTTMQTLDMSVPLITLKGKSHISRVSSSILYYVGLKELIANNDEEYISLAVDLANENNRLNYYKRSIKKLFMDSPICNQQEFTLELECFYKNLIKK